IDRLERFARDELDALVLDGLLLGPAQVPGARDGGLRPGTGRIGGPPLVRRGLVPGAALAADRRPLGEQGPARAAVSRLVHRARSFFADCRLFAVPRSDERRRRIVSARRTALSRAFLRARVRFFSPRRSADLLRKDRSDSAARSR